MDTHTVLPPIPTRLPTLRELLAKCDFARLHPAKLDEVVEKSLSSLPEKNDDRAS